VHPYFVHCVVGYLSMSDDWFSEYVSVCLCISVYLSVCVYVCLCISQYVCLCLCVVGYLSMSDDWFSEYVFEVVVDKKFVPPAVLEVLGQQPKVLPAWDPMGALATGHCTCRD